MTLTLVETSEGGEGSAPFGVRDWHGRDTGNLHGLMDLRRRSLCGLRAPPRQCRDGLEHGDVGSDGL